MHNVAHVLCYKNMKNMHKIVDKNLALAEMIYGKFIKMHKNFYTKELNGYFSLRNLVINPFEAFIIPGDKDISSTEYIMIDTIYDVRVAFIDIDSDRLNVVEYKELAVTEKLLIGYKDDIVDIYSVNNGICNLIYEHTKSEDLILTPSKDGGFVINDYMQSSKYSELKIKNLNKYNSKGKLEYNLVEPKLILKKNGKYTFKSDNKNYTIHIHSGGWVKHDTRTEKIL